MTSKRLQTGTLTELLQDALRAEPALRPVAIAAGLERASLQRFRDGRQSLRLDLADRLAAYYGIIACRRPRRRGR
ncbi:MAG TPA: hypothetical protein PKK06_16355 [Phycisphaerae bacterium]|nr:hypothetical protein [Phycisphaerae bacterium]HNU46808.1 hypothetical protein [Phycisphaerae bacterium]